jgi:Negative regulator of sigma F
MSCREATRLLIYHSGVLPDAVAVHLQRCESCRKLVHALEGAAQGVVPSAPRVHDIKSLMLTDLRPVTPLPSSRVLLFALFVLFVAVMIAGSASLGVRGWESLELQTKASIFGPLLLGAYLLGLAVVRQMAPGSGDVVSPAAGSAAAFALLIAGVAHAFGWHEEHRSFGLGVTCLSVGLIYTAFAALVSWLVVRRGAMLSTLAAGAMGGGLAGFVGVAGIEIRCPNPDVAHILVWHLPVALLGVLGGLALGVAGRRLRASLHRRPFRSHV